MNSLRFKGMVFDLDYTLYDEHAYFFAIFEKFCKKFKCHERLKAMRDSFLGLRPVSKDILGDILEINGFTQNKLRLKNELFKMYTSINADVQPYEDAIFILNNLQSKNIKLGILTNGVIEAQRNKIRCLSISCYFNEIFFAYQLGEKFKKPHKDPFKEISKRLRIPSDRLIFVGDNPNTDFRGAKEIGGFTVRLKRGIYYNMPVNEFIDIEIKNLTEIGDILYE